MIFIQILDCCETVRITAESTLGVDLSGLYTSSGLGSALALATKPLYQHHDSTGADQLCLGYGGGWKVELCTQDFQEEQGFIRLADSATSDCPADGGSRWMYYASSEEQDGIKVECEGKLQTENKFF